MRTSSITRPGVSIRRGADRHQTRIGWLHGRHSFDTGIDPLGTDTHHGVLVVSNHDTIAPRSGFETHPHRNMEIVTWVLNGSLVHQDSEGHAGVIYPNLAQRMTAGTGIRHSEKNDRSAVNPDADRPLELIQMWVVPDEPEVAPGYEQLELDPSDLQGQLAVVASGMTRHRDQAAIRIRNRFAALHVARLDPARASPSRMHRSLTSTSPGAGRTLKRKAHWMRGTLPALRRPESVASLPPSPARS
jgi:redox-sensitive bicupin YhaK (pirin superfamily)